MLQIKSFTVGPFAENTYIIYNQNKQAIIIDPGMYDAKEDQTIFDFLSQEQLKLEQIINTHCHLDHVFGVHSIVTKYVIPFAFLQQEQSTYDWAAAAATKYGLQLNELPAPNYYIKKDDTIKIGEDELKVLFTPGHSPGHVCLYNELGNFVIAGDAIFQMSVGRTDLPGGDTNTLIQSIHREILSLPVHTTIYSGHGPSTTVGFEKMNNPYLR
jgi:hydroxyacylglutathione hydrolase